MAQGRCKKLEHEGKVLRQPPGKKEAALIKEYRMIANKKRGPILDSQHMGGTRSGNEPVDGSSVFPPPLSLTAIVLTFKRNFI